MSTQRLTFYDTYSAVNVHGDYGFQSNNRGAFALFTNETLDASQPIVVNSVLLNVQDSNISDGLFPADLADDCQNNRVGSAGLPGSVACKIDNGRARMLFNGTEWSDVSCDSNAPVLVKITVTNGIVSFFVDGSEVECPQLAENPLHGEVRVGVSTETGQQRGALVEKEGPQGIPDAQKCLASAPDCAPLDDEAPETGPLYTDTVAQSFKVDAAGPIVALTPTVFRCNEAQDGTVYVPVPLCTDEEAAISVSVRFAGIKSGYAGCGFFKKEAIDAGDVHEYLVGNTDHSFSYLLKDAEAFVFIDDWLARHGAVPDSDELTVHFSFDRTKGMLARIGNGVVNCDEFKDLSLSPHMLTASTWLRGPVLPVVLGGSELPASLPPCRRRW